MEGGRGLDWHASVYGSRTGGERQHGDGFGSYHDGFGEDEGAVYGQQSVISDHTLRRLAGSSYIRARQVAASGRMHQLVCSSGEETENGGHGDDMVLSAHVHAADRYAEDYEVHVTVDQEADELHDAFCTCPAFGRYGRICKHVIGLVMAYNKTPERFDIRGNGSIRRRRGVTSRLLRNYMQTKATERQISVKQRHLDLLRDISGVSEEANGMDATDDAERVGASRRMPIGSVSLRVGISHNSEGWGLAVRILVPSQSVSYGVKDIAAFSHAVQLEEFVQYGKHLAFVHTRDAFDAFGQRIIDVLDRAVGIRDSVLVGQRIGLRREYARGTMALSEEETTELLAIHVGAGIAMQYEPRGPWVGGDVQATVIEGDPDLGLAITRGDDTDHDGRNDGRTDGVAADSKSGDGRAPADGFVIRHDRAIVDYASGRSGSFVMVRDSSDHGDGAMTIYRCSASFYRNRALAQTLCGGGQDGDLFLAQDDIETFSRTVLPLLKATAERPERRSDDESTTGPQHYDAANVDHRGLSVRLPKEFVALRREECRIRIYLDRDRSVNGVTCDVRACYGDRSFHVFEGVDPSGVTDGVARDKAVERLAVEAIRQYFPMPQGDLAIIPESDDHAIYRLLTEGLKILRNVGEVFATPAFDGLSVVRHPTIRVGLAMRSGLVEISPIADEIDPKDVPALLESYRKRRKFHRLRDGTFVDTRAVDVSALNEVGDDLGIKAAKLGEGGVTVPAYEAYYLDHEAKDEDKSADFTAYLNDLRVIDPHRYQLPGQLSSILRPYQAEGYRWLSTVCDKGFGGILADEMGLGKTVQLLSLLVARRDQSRAYGPNLIVCPASLVYNWTAECAKFAPQLNVVAVAGSKAARRDALQSTKAAYASVDSSSSSLSSSVSWQGAKGGAVPTDGDVPDVLVTSYDLLRRDIDDYAGLECFCMTLDEAQYIKNHATLSARAARSISARHRFALTGTPIENRLSELWSILDFLMPGMLGSYTHFRQRFELPILSGDTKAQTKLQAFVTPFILRRLKADVVKDLPDKIENVITVQLEGEQRRLYAALEQRLRASLLKQRDMEFATGKIQVLAQLTRLRQVCCDPRLLYNNAGQQRDSTTAVAGAKPVRGKVSSAKLDAIEELVESCQDAGRKMLIFSQFTSYLDLIAQRLREHDVQYDVITGATPKRRRIDLVNQFNRDETPVFLISLKAGNTGLNLTGACVVVHADPWWNAAAQEQATDRAHRIGQTQDVNVYQVVAKDTIEERIVNLQHEKSDLASRFVDSSSSTTGGSISRLTKDDLLQLLG